MVRAWVTTPFSCEKMTKMLHFSKNMQKHLHFSSVRGILFAHYWKNVKINKKRSK